MDVTTLVIEGQDARARMQEAKRRNKAEVRRKYEAQMAAEIADLNAEAEHTFAQTLARINAAGLPQATIRREILRTNVWHIWTYWRDLAKIEPERVSTQKARKAKEEAERIYRRDEDGWWLVRGVNGVSLPEPLRIRLAKNGFAIAVEPQGFDWSPYGTRADHSYALTDAIKADGMWDTFQEDTP